MNPQALLIHILMRHAQVDSASSAGRREHLLRLERETREARRRRRRERVRRSWNVLNALHRKGSDDGMQRTEARDLGQALR